MLKYFNADAPPISLVAAGFATAVTLWLYAIGRRRQQLLTRQPFPTRISPRREVYEVAGAVLALILLSVLSLLL